MTETMTFYSHTDIANMLKVSERTVVRQIQNGKLVAMKVGRMWRVEHEDFLEFKKKVTPTYKRKYA